MKKLKNFPTLINEELLSYIFYKNIMDIYSQLILTKKYKDFITANCLKANNVIENTLYKYNQQNLDKFIISISVASKNKKYNIFNFKIDYSSYIPFDINTGVIQFFINNQNYVSDFLIKNFKKHIIKILRNELYDIKHDSRLLLDFKKIYIKKLQSYKKLIINNKINCKFYPENFTYDLIINLDDSDIITENIDIEKLKYIFKYIKTNKNFNNQSEHTKNTIHSIDLTVDNVKSTDNYNHKLISNTYENTYIYINLEITNNIYINLTKLYVNSGKEINNSKINFSKFIQLINDFIDETKLYCILNQPNTSETQLILKISKIQPNNLVYSTMNLSTDYLVDNITQNSQILYIYCSVDS